MSIPARSFTITAEQEGVTLAALVRAWLPGRTWSQARRLIETRHLRIGEELCLDPARRVHEGEVVVLLARRR